MDTQGGARRGEAQQMWVPAPPTPRPEAALRRRRRARALGGLLLAAGLLAACALAAAAAPGLLPAGGGGRTNVLLLGIDRREGSGWAYRTDTLLVVTLDPAGRAAGILSVPRDLQVPIPGHGEDRINTAHFWGVQAGGPEAGPALAIETVEANFGVPIHGYLLVDFNAFVQIVDALGGIEVDVPVALHDTRYPNPLPEDPYGTKTVHFDAGPQQMDGARAMEYARSRMSTSDFDRARRQQLILLALRRKALSAAGIVRWPVLARAVLGGVRTDLGAAGLARLAFLAARIDPAGVERVVLEQPLVFPHRRADGAAVQLPDWDLIRPVIDRLFGPR